MPAQCRYRFPALVESLLEGSESLALMPVSVMQAALVEGRLVEVRSNFDATFWAIGLLAPEGERQDALQAFLCAMQGTAT